MTRDINSLSDDEQITYGLNTQAELSLIDGHSTVVGFEYEQDRLKASKTRLVTVSPSPPYPFLLRSMRMTMRVLIRPLSLPSTQCH